MDLINFDVDGSHTYAKAGTYPIVVIVTQSFGPPDLARAHPPDRPDQQRRGGRRRRSRPPRSWTERSRAPTSPAPTAADLGGLYFFNGSGTAGDLGPVGAAGQVHTPGFITTGRAYGTLTLTQATLGPAAGDNSVTLNLTGPPESGFGPFPSTLGYVIASGTGAFANATGSGTIDVTFVPDTNQFVFAIKSS